MSVTSVEVAKQAGVSQATVSYVLNATPGQSISDGTRAKVFAAARALGYRRNAAARSLRTGRGEAVLLPLPARPGHVLSQLVEACSNALTFRNLTLVTDVTRYESADEQLDAWLRVHPAAVLDLLLAHDDPVLPALRKAGVAVLTSAEPSEASWVSSADVLAIDARKTQVRHIVDRGHRRITVVIPPRSQADPRIEQTGLRHMRRVASGVGAKISIARAPLEANAIRDLIGSWRRRERPQAVCAYNDDYAIAIISALAARGLRVPDDVAVIGVDDLPAGSWLTPSLTTVAADFSELAEGIALSVTTLLTDPARRVELPPARHRLIVRESA